MSYSSPMKMMASRSTKTSTILLPGSQDNNSGFPESRNRRRQSFMANPLESLKLTVSSIGKKSEEPARKVEAEGQEEEETLLQDATNIPARTSFDVALPQRQTQSQVRFQQNARQFPEDWQTSLTPRDSTLRDNRNRRQSFCAAPTSDKSIWNSLGARCKFFRLVVVASPSLQRLASPHT
ncbi:hypothetical protein PGT21_005496 [Puccinia graminis f. sp. tritici]|uniref:Uncharacterized protein n=1 Tax=Puccinia graminis f. sp. tritici TaxID=56615 RepID=A0A5B0NI10_PUCGR|nr:hypothetical protein PGTUg99_027197 [Puccinia graminis f. sp. tritici]KAA1112663.1 hypothetical protein PGT21_005496 [Puccinia graminis f. sp. tritici]